MPTPPPATYPNDAACGRSSLPPETWDRDVAGETPQQRQARWNAAAAVCTTCPVQTACAAARTDGGGIRVGIAHPDAVPGWTFGESNSWLGWSAQNADLHGDLNGVRRHQREGTNLCVACRGAQNRHNATRYAKGLTDAA